MADDDPKSSAPGKDYFVFDEDEEDPFNNIFDEFEGFTEEDLRNVISNPNPTHDHVVHPLPPVEINNTHDLLDEFDLSITNFENNDEFDVLSFINDDDLMSWNMFEPSNVDYNLNINNNVPSEVGNGIGDHNNINIGETTRVEVSTRVFGDDPNGLNYETGETSSAMHVPVIAPRPDDEILSCTCCKMLREIVYMKDGEVTALNIFGGIGFICHASLLTQVFPSGSVEYQYRTIHDLKYQSMEVVKKFIEDYCNDRVESGLTLVQDINADFYQAMSACSIFNQTLPPMLTIPSPLSGVPMALDQALDVHPVLSHVEHRKKPRTKVPKGKGKRKTALAAQRERTAKLTLKDVASLLDLPIEVAAKQMKLCPTVLKKICRRGGLKRWPHRKLQSLNRKMASLKNVVLTTQNREVKAHAEAEIEKLKRQFDQICADALKNQR